MSSHLMDIDLNFRDDPSPQVLLLLQVTAVEVNDRAMQKKFVSTSTHIFDPANPSTPPIRQSPPPEPQQSAPEADDKRSLYDKLTDIKAKKEEAFQEAHKFSSFHFNSHLILQVT